MALCTCSVTNNLANQLPLQQARSASHYWALGRVQVVVVVVAVVVAVVVVVVAAVVVVVVVTVIVVVIVEPAATIVVLARLITTTVNAPLLIFSSIYDLLPTGWDPLRSTLLQGRLEYHLLISLQLRVSHAPFLMLPPRFLSLSLPLSHAHSLSLSMYLTHSLTLSISSHSGRVHCLHSLTLSISSHSGRVHCLQHYARRTYR